MAPEVSEMVSSRNERAISETATELALDKKRAAIVLAKDRVFGYL